MGTGSVSVPMKVVLTFVWQTRRGQTVSTMGAAGSRENEAAAQEFVDRVTTENGVTVFSKSYCPYCNLVRGSMVY
jgi:hypothetical protein